MNGWHESIKDQTPDHPDHKKPGLVKREQELASAREDEASDVNKRSLLGRGGIGMTISRGIERIDEITPDPLIMLDEKAMKVRQAKKNLKRQQEVNK